MQPMPFSVGSGKWTDPRHFGYMLKGSISSGTTSVTTKRGASNSGHFGTSFGTYNGEFVSSTVVYGLFATQTTGAVTAPRRSCLDTNGAQFSGNPATVVVSIDGSTWYTFTWGADPDGSMNDSYWVSNANGGDVFGLYSVSDGVELKVLVAVPH